MADAISQGARLLEDMLATEAPQLARSAEIKDIEHRCDSLTRAVMQRLNRTFVTPIDREDIHALAGALDDVMDAIDDSASLLSLYRISQVRPGARELAHYIRQSADQVRLALEALDKRDGVMQRDTRRRSESAETALPIASRPSPRARSA